MKILGGLLFLLLTVPVSALAGDITLFSGFQHPGDISLSGAASTVTDPGNAGVFGVRYRHGNFIGIEHTLSYSPNFLDSQGKAFIYNSNFIVDAPAPLVRPYFTAGLGTIISGGNGASDIGTKFAINYGGGVKMRLLGPLKGRFDVRGYTALGVQSQTLKIFETSFGLVFSN